MLIKELSSGAIAPWERFAEVTPESTFFHRAGWKTVIESSFHHACHYLYAEQDGTITGILPLVHVKSRLFSNALISTPFCAYGGAVAVDRATRVRLEEAASDLARKLDVDYVEFRYSDASAESRPTKELYVTFRKSIEEDADRNFSAIPGKQRNIVRKAMKLGLVSETSDQLEPFYRVYSESVRDLGTPVFARRYFERLQATFGRECRITTISDRGNLVSASMNFYFRDQILAYYWGGTRRARVTGAHGFMLWKLMEEACKQGIRVFDYGRSKRGTGAYDFKRRWGFEAKQLHYEYELVKSREMPNISPTNPKYQHFIEAWKRLPLPVSRVVGPWLARSLG